jgi:hypothetical protein
MGDRMLEEIRRMEEARVEAAERRHRRQRRDDIGFQVCIVGLFTCGVVELLIAIVRIVNG